MASVQSPQAQNSVSLPSQGHPSRRDNPSTVSTQSSSGRSERGERGTRNDSHPAVESAVTRLLVAIKQQLEALTLWSTLKIDENQVSDVYVRLGNDFNAAVAAFGAFNIDMTELLSVPDDLRNVLEQCLAEDATPENLELYLPTVRQIITNLLQGLRGKQSIYRRIVSEHKHRSDASTQERSEQRSSRSDRTSQREGTHRSQLSRTIETDRPPSDRGSMSRRGGQTSGRRRDTPSSSSTTISTSSTLVNGDENFAAAPPPPDGRQNGPSQSSRSQSQPRPQRSEPPSTDLPPLPPPHPPTPAAPPNQDLPSQLNTSGAPATMKRYSLVDKPMALPPPVIVEPSSPNDNSTHDPNSATPPPDTPPLLDVQVPAMANSLAALKKSDTLERRASKRFSTYNISKMTGGGGSTSRDRSMRSHPNRRSLAAGSNLSPGDLAVLTEVDEDAEATVLKRDGSSRSRRVASRPSTPEQISASHPVPPLPATPAQPPDPSSTPSDPNKTISSEKPLEGVSSSIESSPQPPASNKFMVFLQLGREVKKVTIEPGLSFSSLRVLFVDKFSYNPGLENFPAVYIRDPSSGVQYELEDMDEVKDKCLLSLNIEPLDQIKQHIDTQISTLSQEIKDLKTVVSSNRPSNFIAPPIIAQPLAESTPNRPTDQQFRHVARRLSRFVETTAPEPVPSLATQIAPQMTGSSQLIPQMTGSSQLMPQMTGGSVLSDYSNRVVNDLKTQFDEVQNLRRDLGIMRQLYTEFMKQTKESLGTLRNQTQSVKQLANSKVGGARGYIDSGKQKLDVRSQNVLTEVERLQDTVEGVKDDVIKRHITPKAQYFKTVKKDIDTVAAELESLKEHIKTIKPMWKKTWEEELQNIVEEQQFLTHQEEFLSDLLEDHKAVVEVYGHVEKVISLRGSGPTPGRLPRNRGFRPPAPEDGHTGLSTVMLEIRGAAVDPERRMKAIEASQKNREKELASRSDELQAELTDFVGGKKLKMTGGAEEAERVRQKRSDMTLKAMFSTPGLSPASSSLSVDLEASSSPPS